MFRIPTACGIHDYLELIEYLFNMLRIFVTNVLIVYRFNAYLLFVRP